MSVDPKEQEIYQLRKENAELRRSNEILQAAVGRAAPLIRASRLGPGAVSVSGAVFWEPWGRLR